MTTEAATPTTMETTLLLFSPLILGLLQQFAFEPGARGWHTRLHKSPYRPPNFVFPLAWTWCYLSMGYASYLVYVESVSRVAKLGLGVLYGVHMVLLNGWGFVVFVMRRLDWGLNVLVALDVLVTVLLVGGGIVVPFAAVLCLPYFCWLLELTYLNMYMYRNNDRESVAEWGAVKKEVQRMVEADVSVGYGDKGEKEE
eukprot:GFKZ01011802.1.p1 GENE.GFKZ01011802.1~~GFKZ01011802.1.p1  ORF type:complete len:198 (-),score=24.39 GFKZ01011802.1:126-719(-)